MAYEDEARLAAKRRGAQPHSGMGGAGSGFIAGTGRWGGTDLATGDMLAQGGSYAGRGPRNWRRSDRRIEEDACEALTRHGDVDASEVTVRVADTEITLEGTVGSRAQKRLAEDVVAAVRGVHDVHNRLRVRTPG